MKTCLVYRMIQFLSQQERSPMAPASTLIFLPLFGKKKKNEVKINTLGLTMFTLAVSTILLVDVGAAKESESSEKKKDSENIFHTPCPDYKRPPDKLIYWPMPSDIAKRERRDETKKTSFTLSTWDPNDSGEGLFQTSNVSIL